MNETQKNRSWVSTVVKLVILAGGLVVANLMGFASVGLAMVGVILFFIGWIVYSQFDWRRAQVSLSTAVVLMFVAGGLLWANTRVDRSREVAGYQHSAKDKPFQARIVDYGWPFQSFTQYKPVVGEKAAGHETIQPKIVLNLAIALAILYVVWLVCEGRGRRKLVRDSVPKEETK